MWKLIEIEEEEFFGNLFDLNGYEVSIIYLLYFFREIKFCINSSENFNIFFYLKLKIYF